MLELSSRENYLFPFSAFNVTMSKLFELVHVMWNENFYDLYCRPNTTKNRVTCKIIILYLVYSRKLRKFICRLIGVIFTEMEQPRMSCIIVIVSYKFVYRKSVICFARSSIVWTTIWTLNMPKVISYDKNKNCSLCARMKRLKMISKFYIANPVKTRYRSINVVMFLTYSFYFPRNKNDSYLG